MVVLRLQPSARADGHQHNWGDFEEAGGQGDPGGYKEGISGREKAATCGSDANVEGRDCQVTPSIHLHRCTRRMPAEGSPWDEGIPYREATCRGSDLKVYYQGGCDTRQS